MARPVTTGSGSIGTARCYHERWTFMDLTTLAALASIIVAIPVTAIMLRRLIKGVQWCWRVWARWREEGLLEAVIDTEKLVPASGLWKLNVTKQSLHLEATKAVSSLGVSTKAAVVFHPLSSVFVTVRKSTGLEYRNPTTVLVQWDNERRVEEAWKVIDRKRYLAYTPPDTDRFMAALQHRKQLALIFEPDVHGGSVVVFDVYGFAPSRRSVSGYSSM